MIIKTNEQYDKIRNNVILKVILIGDEWGDDCGEVFDVIKIDDKLYELPPNRGYWLFSERNDKDYEFIVKYQKETDN